MGAKEGGVWDVIFEALLCADIETVAFDVDAEEIVVGVHFGESDGIFAFAAGQLKCEGVGIFEEGGPLAGRSFGILEDVGKGFDGFEADEFLLAHSGKIR